MIKHKSIRNTLVILLALLLLIMPIFGCSSARDLQRQLDYLNNRLLEQEAELYAIRQAHTAAQNQLAQMSQQLTTEQARVQDLERQMQNHVHAPELQALLRQIEDLKQQILQLEEDYSLDLGHLAGIIRNLNSLISDLNQRIYDLENTFRPSTHFAVIESIADLNAMVAHPNGTFQLGANLILNNFTTLFSAANPFTGVLFAPLDIDGQPLYRISSLSIINPIYSQGNYFAGLIGENRGTISNIIIQNLNITIDLDNPTLPNASFYVGAIAGQNRGTITNSQVANANISLSTEQSVSINAGLITGRLIGQNAIIENSDANGTINTNSILGRTFVGGLAGIQQNNASIYRSSASVDILAITNGDDTHSNVGGLVGFMALGGFIRQSYATGNVVADVRIVAGEGTNALAGGLVGDIEARTTGTYRFEITESFASGNATAITIDNAFVGGLIARVRNQNAVIGGVLIQDTYATGNALIQFDHTTSDAPTNPNHFAGGLIGRVHSFTDSTITVENSFSTGDVFNSATTGDSNWTGHLIGRSQNTGTRIIRNNFVAGDINIDGRPAGLFIVPSGNQNSNYNQVTQITRLNLQNELWQQENLNWNNTTWIFEGGEFPKLNMQSLRANASDGVLIDGLRLSHAPGVFSEEFYLTVEVPFRQNATIYWTIDGTEPGPNNVGRTIVRPNVTHIVSGSFNSGDSILVQDRTTRWEDSILAAHAKNWPVNFIPTWPNVTPREGAEFLTGTSFRFKAVIGTTPITRAITTTYIVAENKEDMFFDTPIISVTAEYEDFVYINHHAYRWDTTTRRRIFNYEFFEPNGESYSRKFSIEGSTQLGGSDSRTHHQRTLNVHLARGELNGVITHPVFDGLNELFRFRLWNGGQSAWYDFLRDPFSQKASSKLGLPYADSRVAIKFVNGEYWGMTRIREHTSNGQFLETRHGMDRGNIAILNNSIIRTENNDMIGFKEVAEGNQAVVEGLYNELIDFIINNDLSTDAATERLFYEFVCKDNFIDYVISNTFFANDAWVTVNIRMFRAITSDSNSTNPNNDGRWRFMLHDMDLAMSDGLEQNLFSQIHNADGVPQEPLTAISQFSRIFRVFNNLSFVEEFVARAMYVVENYFDAEQLLTLYNQFVAELSPVLPKHLERFPKRVMFHFNYNVAQMRFFLQNRQQHYVYQLEELINRLV